MCKVQLPPAGGELLIVGRGSVAFGSVAGVMTMTGQVKLMLKSREAVQP
jgi:hypothetical protein